MGKETQLLQRNSFLPQGGSSAILGISYLQCLGAEVLLALEARLLMVTVGSSSVYPRVFLYWSLS